MFGNTLLEGVFIRLTWHLKYEVRFMTTVIKCLLLNNDMQL